LLGRDLAILHHLQNLFTFFRRHYLPPSKALSNCSACSAVIFFSASIFKIAMRSSSATGSEGGEGGVGIPLGPDSHFHGPAFTVPPQRRDCRSAWRSTLRAVSSARFAAREVACSTWRDIRSPKPDQSKFMPAKFPNSSAELPAFASLVTRISPPALN